MLLSTGRRISYILDLLRPLWVGLFVVLLTVPSPERFPLTLGKTLSLALVFLFLWSLAGWQGPLWRPTPLDLLWGLWVLLIPVTLWATAVPDLTYASLRLFAAQSLSFWTLVVWVHSRHRGNWATAGLLGLGTLLAMLGLFWMESPAGYLFPLPPYLQVLRGKYALPVQESVNKNVLAGTLVPLWGLALGAIWAPQGRWRWPQRALALVSIATMGGMIILSQSRGSWVAMVVATFVLLAMRWRLAWIGLLVLPAGTFTLYVWRPFPFPLEIILALQHMSSLTGRAELWSRALYAVQDFFFTGIGMGTFSRVIPILYPLFFYSDAPHAHNLFLQIALDLGFFGLVAFLAMLFVTGWLIRQGLKRTAETCDHVSAWLLRGAIAGLTAALVHGTVDAVTWNIRPAFLVWALWGMSVGLALTLATYENPPTSHT